MERAVWKYSLQPGMNDLAVPTGAKFLYATAQYDTGVVYALVDPEAKTEMRRVLVVGTGQGGVPAGWQPLGLIALAGGNLMFHAFE